MISVPHGGDTIPPEVVNDINLTNNDILYDNDTLALDIYDLRNDVIALVTMPIARAILDVNRAPDDLPPGNSDGVIKTITLQGKSVYKDGRFPGDDIVKILLKKYYFPYHNKITAMLREYEVTLALDCHTMLECSPSMDGNPGRVRPLVCISNGGDEKGRATGKGSKITCRPEWVQALAESFKNVFASEDDVTMNEPFIGGYTSQYHYRNTGVPWIQIELNRRLYLSANHSSSGCLHVENEKIENVRKKILLTIGLFWKMIS